MIRALRSLAPAERIRALADPGTVANIDDALAAPRPSSLLARWGIVPQEDDGVALARATIFGLPVFIVAQDNRFLGGSAGVNHADALRGLFERAQEQRPAAVVLLAASGGVRLYEANPAEFALARALSALLDLRACGVRVLTLVAGDIFGGSSVVACAADRIAMLPKTRLGLSGPKVIETAHGRGEVDASDDDSVDALFGAEERSAGGTVELVADDADVIRAWIAAGCRDEATFSGRVRAMQMHLAKRLFGRDVRNDVSDVARNRRETPPATLFDEAEPLEPAGVLWRVPKRAMWLAQPPGPRTFGPREAHVLDAELLAHLAADELGEDAVLVLVEDSRGHEATAAAEALCVSQYLAQHAAVIALLRARGVRIVGVLAGTGQGAAFFSNALQASRVHAVENAQVVAMEPAAIARVTRRDPAQLVALMEDDAVLGHPIRHFASWGGIAEIWPADEARVRLERLLRHEP
jgi:malonate decarboxylase beta subunit